MLKLYDQNKNPLGYIMKYGDDLCIESDLSNGDKSLSFTYLAKNPKDIKNEYYIETKDDRYVVKEVGVSSNGFPEFKCQLDLEDLEADMFENFSAMNCTLEDAANLALAGTGWTVNTEIAKLRSVATMKATPLTILGKIRDAWMCEIQYDNKNKIVYFKNKLGEDKGVYFTRSLNLRKVELTSDSYDYYTRIIPIGADGLRITDVNGGKKYVENYQYSNKVRTLIWEDSSYEDAMALLEDAEKKLEDLSKPKKSYSADVVDLAKQNPNHSILSYSLGDTVLLLDERTGIKDKQRIVRLTEYPRKPENNSCELSNITLTFEEQQERLQAAADAVENITRADGTVNGVYVHGVEADGIVGIEVTINNSEAVSNINNQVSGIQTKIDFVNGELAIAAAKIGTLETTALTATTADLRYATIDRADILEGYVHNLEVDYGNFKTLTADEFAAKTAEIEKLSGDFASFKVGEFEILKSQQAEFEIVTANKFTAQTAEIQKISGEFASFKTGEFEELRSKQADFEEATANNFTATNGQIEHLSGEFASYKTTMSQELIAAKGWMLEGSIGNAQISSIDATKIKSGIIDTSLLTVKGSEGKLQIIDNTMQISDSNRVRVQIGKDASNDYSMSVWDQNGLLIWDALGATENTIQRKIIRDKMVAEDAAIQAFKIDFQSFETALTNQGVTISGTVVQVGNKTLNVELSEQKQYVDDSIDNIEIGGRNYIHYGKGDVKKGFFKNFYMSPDGYGYFTLTSKNTYSSISLDYGFIMKCRDYVVGSKVTISYDFMYTEWNFPEGTNHNELWLGQRYGNQTISGGDTTGQWRSVTNHRLPVVGKDGCELNKWIHVEYTVTIPEQAAEGIRDQNSILFYNSNPDVAASITFRIKNVKLEYGNKATDWTPAPEDTQTQIDEHTETLSDHSTKISANEKAINLRVTSQEYEAYKATVNGEIASHNSRLNTAESSIDILQDKITFKVEQTDITNAIDNLEIGGRNLISNLVGNWSAGNWSIPEVGSPTVLDTGYPGRISLKDPIDISPNKEYWVKIYSSKSVSVLFRLLDKDGKFISSQIHMTNQKWTSPSNCYGICVTIYDNSTIDDIADGTTKIKLEEGNKPTALTPAPEDVDSAIANVDGKFANYSTTTQMQTAIELSTTSILSSVSETYATKTEVDALETWKSEASQLITKDGIISTVGNYYATSTDLDAATGRITAAEAVIKQHAESIELRVEKAGVISAINQTSESIKIAASKINLDGYVTMTDLSTAGKTTIVGDNITSGTITGINFVGATGDFTGSVTATNLIAVTTGKLSIFDFNEYGMSVDFTGDNMLDYSFRKEYFCARVYNSSNAERAYFYMDTEDSIPGINGRAIVYAHDEISLRVPSTGVVTVVNESDVTRTIFLNPNGDIYTRGYNISINHSVILRNDGSNFYMLINNSDEVNTVSWNSLRPFTITKSNGHVSIGNGLSVTNDLTVSGLAKITSNGNTVTIGSQNTGWCHFNNSADIPFHFNRKVSGAGGFEVYNNGSYLGTGYIELIGGTPFIDFHFGNSTADYTSRIIESSSGVLKVLASLVVERNTNNPLTVQTNMVESSIKYSSTAANYFWAVGPGAGQNSFDRFGFYNGSGGAIAYIDKNGGMVLNGNVTCGGLITPAISSSGGAYISLTSSGALNFSGKSIVPPEGNAGIRSNGDGKYDCGHTSNRWGTVYSKNGVSTSSDEREKDILNLELTELSDYFMSLKPIAYRWTYGNDNKIHLGLGAQTSERKMIERGYDPSQFAMIQHDDLEEVSATGLTERYAMNYQELQMLTMMQTQKTTRDVIALKEWQCTTDIELAIINQRQDMQETRIRELEQKIINLELENERLKAALAS